MNNPTSSKAGPKVRAALKIFYAFPVIFVLAVCGYVIWAKVTHQGPPVRHISSKPFASVAIAGLTANLFTEGDQLHAAGNDLFIEFRDTQGHLADVGDVDLMLELKMPDSVMHSIGKVMRTATPGQYRTMLEPQMAGDWTATLDYSGPRGKAITNFYATVVK